MKYLLPLLALMGLFFAGYTVVSSNHPMPIAQAVAEPSSSPFKEFIAGAGIIEAQSQNIAIGTPLPRIVNRVAVKVGDTVKAGAPLFYLDAPLRPSTSEYLNRRRSRLIAPFDLRKHLLNVGRWEITIRGFAHGLELRLGVLNRAISARFPQNPPYPFAQG